MDDPSWPRVSDWILGPSGDGPRVDLIGVPSSIASITPSDARRAPEAFRAALAGFSPFDGERSIDLTDVSVVDHGDLDIADASMVTSQARILEQARSLPASGVRIHIGGDNAITRPLVRSLDRDLATVGVITLDAHHDVRSLADGPTNGTPIRGLIEDGLPGTNVVQIGIHSFANSAAYRSYCEDHGVRIVTMADVEERGAAGAVEAALYRLERCDVIYVDFDLDVLDRAHAPACPGARPGGMSPRQLSEIAFRLGRHPSVVAADLVEVDPTRDVGDRTIQAMATTFLSFVSGVSRRGSSG